ncbi:DUF2291 family protein [Hoeflea ulvae]|uniref:DUF2291 domain-containing protein n=1 Tax=Hoeflea ulvae TaxID=2983764 RepID=A0ABT3YLV2_9HYPH|nr:DUF2291 domain-containing protein [Hoeflea ulvae]MCY0096880.1 DUF2291 domain-containing protein [Hoeflea ulvae]
MRADQWRQRCPARDICSVQLKRSILCRGAVHPRSGFGFVALPVDESAHEMTCRRLTACRAAFHTVTTESMMMRTPLLTLCAVAVFALSGCKLVKNPADGEQAVSAGASGDNVRTEQRIADTFETQLLPWVEDKALDFAALKAALAQGLDAAGEAHGNRGSGAGAAWNFAVTDTGTVVSANLESRARIADLDIDGDGAADITVQLGPVIRGNALRDFAPFYNFDDFRDQIEFAKLGRALNDRISAMLELPEGDLIGRSMAFIGVVPLKKADEAMILTPTRLDVMP